MALCILCGTKLTPTEDDDACPGCGAQDRTRMLGLALMRAAPQIAYGKPVVHVAPERGLTPFMRGRYGRTWTPVDFEPSRYQHSYMDREVKFCDLTRPFDFFEKESLRGLVHSHVLEHIPTPLEDFLPKMNELVAPRGFHAFIVPGPFPPHYEEDLDPSVTREERMRRFKHPEHMRIFGTDDWEDRVERHFEGWTKVDLKRFIKIDELDEAGISGRRALTGLSGKTVHLYIKA